MASIITGNNGVCQQKENGNNVAIAKATTIICGIIMAAY